MAVGKAPTGPLAPPMALGTPLLPSKIIFEHHQRSKWAYYPHSTPVECISSNYIGASEEQLQLVEVVLLRCFGVLLR